MKNINILGISGSLRADSTNTLILKTLAAFLPENINFQMFEGLDQIPHFSPGLSENDGVIKFKKAIRQADGVIICTPEYAFGVPGTLKNALDWTVSTGDLNDKPVSAISASPLNTGGDKALASLLLTLTALGTLRNEESSLSIPNIKLKINDLQQITDEPTLHALKAQCDNLLKIIG
ncbi:NAD(P)H-dependent oxidoreductase [Dyadobacter sp. LJ53]|uniref:NADPH-dependent FMN reductase n=1 Tax=Dyadobacter chenwenxiniae TaxID=2906456 RepID=UPI001F3BDBED|nr:NAD(P)H-dependent oxidoreductase [Dyadobacter chenwenxiniae]MCF0050828.1 NAD(P)H-dependent oxidoreductase [Dyadobacter chenwenxiniae]